jgi:Flp pilus assembly protein TadD
MMLGNYEYQQHHIKKALDLFDQVTRLNPEYAQAYNMLAYTYAKAGDIQGIRWAVDKYAAIATGQANPYDTKGNLP